MHIVPLTDILLYYKIVNMKLVKILDKGQLQGTLSLIPLFIIYKKYLFSDTKIKILYHPTSAF